MAKAADRGPDSPPPSVEDWIEGMTRVEASESEDGVLDAALDAIIRVSGARRGFIVAVVEGGTEVRVARNLDEHPIKGSERALSRSIVDDALRQGKPLWVPDAQQDPRYGASAVVGRLKLLSVMALPFRIEGEVAGVVYLDHDAQASVFSPSLLPAVSRFLDLISATLGKLRRIERLGAERKALLDRLERQGGFEGIVGTSAAMAAVLEKAEQFAKAPWPVLLVGESGSGKELIARAIHKTSPRAAKEFLPLNIASIPETLIEDTLFGHDPGAFADARTVRKGYFESANGGTLFLDEIGDASASVQVKLLRVVQFGEVQRLGSDRPVKVDVRLIAATNVPLEKAVAEGRFRSDLLHRLNPLTLRVPPLRERPEDIPPLVSFFLRRHEAAIGAKGTRISPGALARLAGHDYTDSNVRCLENFVKYMLAVGKGRELTEADLPPEVLHPAVRAGAKGLSGGAATYAELEAAKGAHRDLMDRAFIERAVRAAGGNVVKAAAQTGANRRWFYTRARDLGIDMSAL